MKKEFLEKCVKLAFVLSFIFISSLFFLRVFIKGQKDINYLENRTAYMIPSFSLYSFLDGTFQNNLELSINDQIWASELLKKANLRFVNLLFGIFEKPLRGNSYNLIGKNLYNYGNNDYLVYLPYDSNFINLNEASIKKVANLFESFNIKEKYLYVINNDKSIDFDDIDNDFYEQVIKYYPSYKTSYLAIDSLEDYMNYFYKTDHHWNYKGAYQGYKDIIKMIFGSEEKVLEPVKEVKFKYITYGSKANTKQYFKFKENFTAYKFDMPNFNSYVDGKEMEYGFKSKFFKNPDCEKEDYILNYANFYGLDYGEVMYDFHQSDKDNLLIIGYSDTNAVNELIASHFNKAYIIDFRHIGEINVNDYIEEKEIDKLLYIANPSVFSSEELINEVR